MKILKLLTLILPLIALVAMIGIHSTRKNTGMSWVVDIEGYDPRDLLRGHYLTYRYDWNWQDTHNENTCMGRDCCLCLNAAAPNTRINPHAHIMACDTAQHANTCDSFIKGNGYGTRQNFRIGNSKDNGLTRYYIPEKHAKKLDEMLRARNNDNAHNFAIGLRVNDRGRAFIDTLYINQKPLNYWLNKFDFNYGDGT